MQEEFNKTVQNVLAEARKVSGISDFERAEFYEPLKTIIYDLLHIEGMTVGEAITDAVSWLRQNVQVEQSHRRVAAAFAQDLPET